MADDDRQIHRLQTVELDEQSLGAASRDQEQERQIAIFDLLEENYFHPDGAEHAMTLQARKFARTLRNRFKLAVFEVDERYSTTEALANGATDPDAGAACVILEQFLRGLS